MKNLKTYWKIILPPIILYVVSIFEKRDRITKEKIILLVVNLLFWMLLSSLMLTPQVWGLSENLWGIH